MTKDQKIIRAKVGLLELAKQLGNVSRAEPRLPVANEHENARTLARPPSGGS